VARLTRRLRRGTAAKAGPRRRTAVLVDLEPNHDRRIVAVWFVRRSATQGFQSTHPLLRPRPTQFDIACLDRALLARSGCLSVGDVATQGTSSSRHKSSLQSQWLQILRFGVTTIPAYRHTTTRARESPYPDANQCAGVPSERTTGSSNLAYIQHPMKPSPNRKSRSGAFLEAGGPAEKTSRLTNIRPTSERYSRSGWYCK